VDDQRLGALSTALLRRLRASRRSAGIDHPCAALERDVQLGRWAMAGNAQACPACWQLVQRASGCDHMTCACGAEFCYSCGAEWGTCKSDTGGCAGSGPRLAVTEAMLRERRRARALAFVLGSHPRLGANSTVGLLTADTLGAIVAKVMEGGGG